MAANFTSAVSPDNKDKKDSLSFPTSKTANLLPLNQSFKFIVTANINQLYCTEGASLI